VGLPYTSLPLDGRGDFMIHRCLCGGEVHFRAWRKNLTDFKRIQSTGKEARPSGMGMALF